jgi:hypothetical protein
VIADSLKALDGINKAAPDGFVAVTFTSGPVQIRIEGK